MIKPYKILFLFSLIYTMPIIAMDEESESFLKKDVYSTRPHAPTTNHFTSNSKFNIQGPNAAKEIAKAMIMKNNLLIILFKELINSFAVGIGGGIAQNISNTGKRVLKHILPTPEEIRSKIIQNGEMITQALGLVIVQIQLAKELEDYDQVNVLNQYREQLQRAQTTYFNDIEKLVTGRKSIAAPEQQRVPIPKNTAQQKNSSETIDDDDDEYKKRLAKLEEPDVAAPQV